MADRRVALFVFHLLLLNCSAHFLGFNITVPRDYKIQGEDAYACTVLQLPEKGYKLVGDVHFAGAYFHKVSHTHAQQEVAPSRATDSGALKV